MTNVPMFRSPEWPYDAKAVGDYTGLMPPFQQD